MKRLKIFKTLETYIGIEQNASALRELAIAERRVMAVVEAARHLSPHASTCDWSNDCVCQNQLVKIALTALEGE